jgi:nucleolin
MGKDDKEEQGSDQEEPREDYRQIKPDEEEDQGATNTKRKRKRKRKKKADEQEVGEKKEGSETPVESSSNSVECTVYVEGIPFDCSPDQVKEFFQSNGIADILELRLPTWQDSGRLRGYGHVLFASQKSFKTALTLSGKYLQKRYLTIQAANAPKSNSSFHTRSNTDDPPPPDCKTLFVHNLPYSATEDDVTVVFENYGLTGVRIARNSVTRQSKGFCYIDVETPKDAESLMRKKEPFVVGGRRVRLDYDSGRMKGSFRAQSGRLWTKEKEQSDKRQRYNN